jgi:hypothetical protein
MQGVKSRAELYALVIGSFDRLLRKSTPTIWGTFPEVTVWRLMPERFEDQPWYREWHEALEGVIATSMARDRTVAGTPEREAAQRECDSAMAAFRDIANRIR